MGKFYGLKILAGEKNAGRDSETLENSYREMAK